MAEVTTTGAVLWVKLVPDDGGKIVFRIGERDENARFRLTELDPTTYSLPRAHPVFSAAESTLFTSMMYEGRVAVTADDGVVTSLAMASRLQTPFESTDQHRKRTAEGPTEEWMDELAGRVIREAENQVAMFQAELDAMRNQRQLGRRPPNVAIPREPG
jgi:hypothetical protein